MLEDFLSYIETNLSINHEDKILLSISGGIDSMVMLHLFKELGCNIAVAHINHSTRNGASDRDMSFVKSICDQNNIPFYGKTLNYDALNQGNFQENARNQRYTFLAFIQEKINANWIATAHHKNDRWETFLMHLNRKSGIQGLTSLRIRNNHIIHPLLMFTKEDIKTYAAEHKIEYVHDISNDLNDYLRNSVRNLISPAITEVFPDFILNANESINNLEKEASLLHELIEKSGIVTKEKKSGYTIIDLEQLSNYSNADTLLFHILDKYGFNFSTVKDITKSKTTGAIFQSSKFEGLLDRGKLIIRLKEIHQQTNLTVDAMGEYYLPNGNLLKVEINKPMSIPNHLWLDKEKISWPLTIRNIREGDKFKPHGMHGATKTIKKLCTDLKISLFEKEALLVVCENEIIIQIIGIKSADNYVAQEIKSALTFNIVV
jgi:tRNA(Ile)-lysidine synthase